MAGQPDGVHGRVCVQRAGEGDGTEVGRDVVSVSFWAVGAVFEGGVGFAVGEKGRREGDDGLGGRRR